ncbi:YbaB/EbfC family nucleoid-associated protein [Zavarzinia aquatilis]|uniref:Nucleoid-associated protein DKG74_19725 n=1 Tax=Zavarzinia aquatilis TaxID=2211142 RepID=A0A317DZ69_9PROT|nr:YbaB/EbfC family nucleoid-associated protein [Zavarzinia aquatilis]PWR18185.1 YbaB/EbfC family nucleoid-associated protein [Zavarzinia aquatilis]
MNFDEIMKQAQAMQARMTEMQSGLDNVEIEGRAGGGLLKVVMNGKGDVKRVKIDPSLIVADEAEVLEDLIVAAHRDAKAKIEVRMAEEMQKATAGLGLPGGFKLPF